MRYDLIATGALAALLDAAMPIALALFLRRRLGTRWRLAGVGALAFVASQVVHVPLVLGATHAFRAQWLPSPPEPWWWLEPLLLGVLAGACEEPARWLAFRFVLRRDEDRGRAGALMVGAGHGGIESIFVGVLVPLTLANMIAMHGMDAAEVAALSGGQLDASAAEKAAAQVAAFWASPAWSPLLSTWERATAIVFHVSMSALVAFGVRRRASRWTLPLAIALHTLLNAVAVYCAPRFGPVVVELALLALVAPVSSAILVATWRASRDDRGAGA